MSPVAAGAGRLLAGGAGWAVLALGAYHLAVAARGWRPRPAPGDGSGAAGVPGYRLRVVVPAHDEARVVEGLLRDLADQTRLAERVVVLADRCTDATAERARAWAEVHEREAGPDGKAALLDWHLAASPLAADEALVVLDADNRVEPDFLGAVAARLAAGAHAVQANVDATNPDESLVATASALTFWAAARMVHAARDNLGWPVDLQGTGMVLTAGALAAAGGFGSSLTDDQDLSVRLALAGVGVEWAHEARVRDEKASRLDVAVRQRARWQAGKASVLRAHGRALASGALRGRWGHADLLLRLAQPGRSFLLLLHPVLGAVAAAAPGSGLPPARLWALATAVQAAAPVPFLVREGVPARHLRRYPAAALVGALWPVARLARRGVRGWYHSPHGGGSGCVGLEVERP